MSWSEYTPGSMLTVVVLGPTSTIMLLLLAKAGMDLTVITMRQTTTALQIPAGIVYLSVPLCCTAMALVQLEHLLTPTATSRDTLADDATSSPRQGDAS